jgi:hypothetical protein
MISLSGEPLHLRPIEPRHENYVLETWVKTWRDMWRGSGVPEELIVRGVRPIAEGLLRHTIVAVTERSPATVHAWICGEPGAVFFLYLPHELIHTPLRMQIVNAVCRPEAP